MVTIDGFKELISGLLQIEVEEEEEKLLFRVRSPRGRTKDFEIEKSYIEHLSNNINNINKDSETVIHDGNYYEVLTRFEGYLPTKNNDEYIFEDSSNGITYEYDGCSDEFLLVLLCKIKEKGLASDLGLYRNRLNRLSSFAEEPNFFDLLQRVFSFRVNTLRIRSNTNKSPSEFESLSNSFIFHMGFNFDYAIIRINFIDEFLKSDRMSWVRSIDISEVDTPKRRYDAHLVYHYQMALSTDSPMLQYISYYHIMENFFEKIYNDDVVNFVKKELTKPSFSVKRDNDVNKLIRIISKRLKDRGDNFSFNEQEALFLTLTKYVDVESLSERISAYNSMLIEHYRRNEVTFSKGDRVNLAVFEDQTLNSLALRIYKTRNSLVHSKESQNKSRYVPFRDDQELLKEIPLMRFIAEDIIISESDII